MRFSREQEILHRRRHTWSRRCASTWAQFVPQDRRNFFWIVAHHDPVPLYTHFYHWFELAADGTRRRTRARFAAEPLLYNIFDSRNEGTATGVEEMFMHAGPVRRHPSLA